MKALITALLVMGLVWTTPAQEKPRPGARASAVQPNYTLVELFAVMVVVGGLAVLNIWIRVKAANAPTDSRQIWPPDTNTIAGNVQTPSWPVAVGTISNDLAVVIHPDITSQGLLDSFGPYPTLFTSAFETVLLSAEQPSSMKPLYTVRGFVSAHGVWTFLLQGTNYVAQSYSPISAGGYATNTFPGASIGTGAEPSKFYRLAAP